MLDDRCDDRIDTIYQGLHHRLPPALQFVIYDRYHVANMAATATAITPVVSQPIAHSGRGRMNGPMTFGCTASTGTASSPIPMMPAANRAKVKTPAIGRSASAAWAEVWISVIPCACNVAAVVMMMNRLIRLENPMPR